MYSRARYGNYSTQKLFVQILRRVMLNEESRRRHRYRLSYYATCGDSVDPDLEDVGQWEEELQEGEWSVHATHVLRLTFGL
jgi:hypothetical protein